MRKWFNRFLLLFVAGIGALTMVVALWGPSTLNHRDKRFTRASKLLDLTVRQFSDEGLLWEAYIKKATSDSKARCLKAEDINIYWPERDLTVEADSGRLLMENMKMQLQGNIQVLKKDMKIMAPRIERNPENQQIKASGGIKVIAKGYTITADEGILRRDGIIEVRGKVNAVFGN